jgi:hemerythrin-like domain-containing protein
MNFRALMLAGPTKANELFDRLAETTDGAVKTREKLFSELKGELELHISLEEQHLFPILRRNAETKDLVPGAIKDNKELRTKLAELEGLPKNDETFSERLKALQKAFRQHARDEKRELLPAVQRALSEEQVQNVAEKIEAGLAEADQARHNELEARRAKMRQDREQSERHAEQQETAERAKQAATGQSRQADSDAAIDHARDETQDRPRDSAEAVERIATAARPMSSKWPRVIHSVLAMRFAVPQIPTAKRCRPWHRSLRWQPPCPASQPSFLPCGSNGWANQRLPERR